LWNGKHVAQPGVFGRQHTDCSKAIQLRIVVATRGPAWAQSKLEAIAGETEGGEGGVPEVNAGRPGTACYDAFAACW
jgi:hypothetical protein